MKIVREHVELSRGGSASPLSSHVALTRVGSRRDLWIYRPFDRTPFCSGQKPGPSLLLRHLRHEDIDWDEIEREHTPSALFRACGYRYHKQQVLYVAGGSQKTPLKGISGTATKLPTRRCMDYTEVRRCQKCDERKGPRCVDMDDWEKAGRTGGSKGYCTK